MSDNQHNQHIEYALLAPGQYRLLYDGEEGGWWLKYTTDELDELEEVFIPDEIAEGIAEAVMGRRRREQEKQNREKS